MTSPTVKSTSILSSFLQRLRSWFGFLHFKGDWKLVIAVGLFSLVLAGLFYTVYSVRQQSVLEVGKPSPKLYKSTRDTITVNQLETEKKRRAAREQIDDLFIADEQLQQLVVEAIQVWELSDGLKQFVTEAYSQPEGVSDEALKTIIEEALALLVTEDAASVVLEVEAELEAALPSTSDSDVLEAVDGDAAIGGESQAEVFAASVPLEERLVKAREVLERDLLATNIVDVQATEDARAAAADSIEQVDKKVLAGQTIVAEGSLITAEHLKILEDVGLYTPARDSLLRKVLRALGSLLLGLLLSLSLLYSYPFLLKKFGKRQIVLLAILVLLLVLLQRLAFLIHPAFIIVALVPILIAVVHSNVMAVAISAWLSLVVALIVPEAPVFTLVTCLATTVVASLTTGLLHSRTSLLLSGLLGGLVAVCAALGYSLLVADIGSSTLLAVSYILFGSIIAAFLALGSLPLLESNFGFLTEYRLLELMNPVQPLLQRLLSEAPGTYQHSLIISNLVDQAVTSIGGDALLTRVAALYHDVGKLKRPHFFTENQFGGDNPHDHLSPHLSFLIITSHVRDGVELLQEHKLPKALEPFVEQHHGTTVLSYFYKRALEENSQLEDFNFRYAGPRPQSKEIAVLMLADAVESASRSLDDPSQGSIRALIDRIIEQRLQGNQLAESPLNLHDLEVIANTFERVMMATLHRRVKYPSEEEIRGLQIASKDLGLKLEQKSNVASSV